MARITVEDCLKSVPNRFALVILATKRAKQLEQIQSQAPKDTSPNSKANKPIVMALREIADGKVRFMSEEEAKAYELEQAESQAANTNSDGGVKFNSPHNALLGGEGIEGVKSNGVSNGAR